MNLNTITKEQIDAHISASENRTASLRALTAITQIQIQRMKEVGESKEDLMYLAAKNTLRIARNGLRKEKRQLATFVRNVAEDKVEAVEASIDAEIKALNCSELLAKRYCGNEWIKFSDPSYRRLAP